MGLNRFQIISGCSWLALKIRPSLSYTPHISPFSFKGTLCYSNSCMCQNVWVKKETHADRLYLVHSTKLWALGSRFEAKDCKVCVQNICKKRLPLRAMLTLRLLPADSHFCWLPFQKSLHTLLHVTPPSTKHSSAAPHPTAGASVIPFSLTLAASHSFLHKIFCSSCSLWPSKQSWE